MNFSLTMASGPFPRTARAPYTAATPVAAVPCCVFGHIKHWSHLASDRWSRWYKKGHLIRTPQCWQQCSDGAVAVTVQRAATATFQQVFPYWCKECCLTATTKMTLIVVVANECSLTDATSAAWPIWHIWPNSTNMTDTTNLWCNGCCPTDEYDCCNDCCLTDTTHVTWNIHP